LLFGSAAAFLTGLFVFVLLFEVVFVLDVVFVLFVYCSSSCIVDSSFSTDLLKASATLFFLTVSLTKFWNLRLGSCVCSLVAGRRLVLLTQPATLARRFPPSFFKATYNG